MIETFPAKKILSILLNGETFTASLVEARRGERKVTTILPPFPLTDNVNLLDILSQKIGAIDDEETLIISSLPASATFIRPLEMALTKESKIDQVIEFEAEPLLPYPIEESVVDRTPILYGEESSLHTLYSVKKERMEQFLATLESYQIDPEIVTTVPLALTTFGSHYFEIEEPTLILSFERERSIALLVERGKLYASRVLDCGIDSILSPLAEELDLSEKEAFEEIVSGREKLQTTSPYPLFNEAVTALFQQISQAHLSMKTVQPGLEPGAQATKLLVLGEGSVIPSLEPALAEALSVTPSSWSREESGLSSEELRVNAAVIGTALSSPGGEFPSINFRRGELSFSNPYKRLKKPALQIILLSLLTAFSLYLFGSYSLKNDQKEIGSQFLTVLQDADLSLESFEREYQGIKKEIPFTAPVVEEICPDEILDRLDFLKRKLKREERPFPLEPNTPKVLDFLAWIESHEKVKGEEGSGLLFQSINYTLVKFPDLNKPHEKYRVKVDLEFTSESSTPAREFHDALIAPNRFLMEKEDVKWRVSKGGYRASFFLKDRTFYPPKKSRGS